MEVWAASSAKNMWDLWMTFVQNNSLKWRKSVWQTTVSHLSCFIFLWITLFRFILNISSVLLCVTDFPYSLGLLDWHWGNHMIAPVPVKQPWGIWVNGPYWSWEKWHNHNKTQQSKKKNIPVIGFTKLHSTWTKSKVIIVCWNMLVDYVTMSLWFPTCLDWPKLCQDCLGFFPIMILNLAMKI